MADGEAEANTETETTSGTTLGATTPAGLICCADMGVVVRCTSAPYPSAVNPNRPWALGRLRGVQPWIDGQHFDPSVSHMIEISPGVEYWRSTHGSRPVDERTSLGAGTDGPGPDSSH